MPNDPIRTRSAWLEACLRASCGPQPARMLDSRMVAGSAWSFSTFLEIMKNIREGRGIRREWKEFPNHRADRADHAGIEAPCGFPARTMPTGKPSPVRTFDPRELR